MSLKDLNKQFIIIYHFDNIVTPSASISTDFPGFLHFSKAFISSYSGNQKISVLPDFLPDRRILVRLYDVQMRKFILRVITEIKFMDDP